MTHYPVGLTPGPTAAKKRNVSGLAQTDKRPLCIDLDGTLVATDTLWESILLFLKEHPFSSPLLLVWFFLGRAEFKRRIAARVLPSAAALPYRASVQQLVLTAREEGRPVYLVTAADQRIADSVAAHLETFDGAFGTEDGRNLKGKAKAAFLEERFGREGFDYAGDSSSDIAVWQAAASRYAVGASSSTLTKARRDGEVVEIEGRSGKRLRSMIRALRPHQWAKNALLFVAAIVGHRYTDPWLMLDVLTGFFAFSLCASSVYVVNDLFDLESDRQHRSKRRRPLASGAITIPEGIVLGVGVLALGLGISMVFLGVAFTLTLLGYLATTTAYTFYLKRKLLVDTITLALLFTYRVVAGGVAANVEVSFWLLAFSLFFFTGLAFVKRYAELAALAEKNLEKSPGRNYFVVDLDIVRSIGVSSGLAAVLIMCLYINSPEVTKLYARPDILYLMIPVLLYWIGRIWFLAGRSQLDDDPVVFALRDRISILAGVIVMALVVTARLLEI